MIPEGPEVGVREVLVAHLHFLQAHHVGRAAFQPMHDELHCAPAGRLTFQVAIRMACPVSHLHFIRGAGMVHTAAARSTSAQRTSALACVDRSSQPCFGQASIGSPRTAAVPVRWDSRRRASISSLNVRHAPSRLYPQPPSLGAGVGPQGSPACPEPAGKRHATLNLAEAKVSTSARLRDPDDLPGVHRKVLHGVVEARSA